MATLAQKIQCERRPGDAPSGRAPDPDRVEYGHTCIRLFWEDTKIVLVVDIDKPPNGYRGSSVKYLADLDGRRGRWGADDLEATITRSRRLRTFETMASKEAA